MERRIFNKKGETICPMCGKEYKPELGERKRPNVLVQMEFPSASREEREQLITDICSNECWSRYLG